MKAFVLGTPDDVRGFALAGVPGATCGEAGDVDRAIALARTLGDLALVIVSEKVLRFAPEKIALLAAEPPAVLVLP